MEITVKDLIDYLKSYPETTVVELDKHGWDTSEESPSTIIKQTGLFWYYKDTLIINN